MTTIHKKQGMSAKSNAKKKSTWNVITQRFVIYHRIYRQIDEDVSVERG